MLWRWAVLWTIQLSIVTWIGNDSIYFNFHALSSRAYHLKICIVVKQKREGKNSTIFDLIAFLFRRRFFFFFQFSSFLLRLLHVVVVLAFEIFTRLFHFTMFTYTTEQFSFQIFFLCLLHEASRVQEHSTVWYSWSLIIICTPATMYDAWEQCLAMTLFRLFDSLYVYFSYSMEESI